MNYIHTRYLNPLGTFSNMTVKIDGRPKVHAAAVQHERWGTVYRLTTAHPAHILSVDPDGNCVLDTHHDAVEPAIVFASDVSVAAETLSRLVDGVPYSLLPRHPDITLVKQSGTHDATIEVGYKGTKRMDWRFAHNVEDDYGEPTDPAYYGFVDLRGDGNLFRVSLSTGEPVLVAYDPEDDSYDDTDDAVELDHIEHESRAILRNFFGVTF